LIAARLVCPVALTRESIYGNTVLSKPFQICISGPALALNLAAPRSALASHVMRGESYGKELD
ncbi:MAG TPA: hypothetical protein VFO63_15495, partial [Blastocatellia bacterium]|nr:hypothetical protein [Blastocatellia bacterium]